MDHFRECVHVSECGRCAERCNTQVGLMNRFMRTFIETVVGEKASYGRGRTKTCASRAFSSHFCVRTAFLVQFSYRQYVCFRIAYTHIHQQSQVISSLFYCSAISLSHLCVYASGFREGHEVIACIYTWRGVHMIHSSPQPLSNRKHRIRHANRFFAIAIERRNHAYLVAYMRG